MREPDAPDFMFQGTLNTSPLVISRELLEHAVTTGIAEPNESLRLLQHAPALIWRSDTNAKCYWFNDPWLTFTGRTLEQEAGDGWAEGVHPEEFDMCLSTFLTCFEARRPFAMEYRFRRYDGAYRWILDHGIPSYNAQAMFDGYIGYCFDITDRKNMEQSIVERAEELERLNADLQLARDALEHLALHDNLTGLSNRHDLLRQFDLVQAQQVRVGTPLSLLLIDLDFFKSVNDRYGHIAGDECLKAVAHELKKSARSADIVSRFGGEEFVMLLPSSDSVTAFKAATQLCHQIAAVQFSILGHIIPLTVSIGGATMLKNESFSFQDILQRADEALYRAKRAGRNRALMAESVIHPIVALENAQPTELLI